MKYYRKKGFTLIELLIVIALIGILAVALISTINPLEQTRKARDTDRRNAARELIGALDRYNANYGCWPWEYDEDSIGNVCNDTRSGSWTLPGTVWANQAEGIASLVTQSQEMKAEYFNRSEVLSDIAIAEDTTGTGVVSICFVPESTTFADQAPDPDDTGHSADNDACNVVATGADPCICVP